MLASNGPDDDICRIEQPGPGLALGLEPRLCIEPIVQLAVQEDIAEIAVGALVALAAVQGNRGPGR
jgi:hypothetical protein